MSEGQEKIDEYTYEFALLNAARTKMLNKDRDWQRVQVRPGWRRPRVVEDYLRRQRG
ncbi:unnamed protein product, partial [Amoebophrya sp. A25]|eukprot:GSA25T00020972001.1